MTPGTKTLHVLSDVHYACDAERARGVTEFDAVENPLLRLFVRAYRHFIWRRDPFAHNPLLDRFIAEARGAEFVIANGDYSCDTAFVGLSDEPSRESARICLGKLRDAFGSGIAFTMGDHELGKTSLVGGRGGLRIASWQRALELGIEPVWRRDVGGWVLLGVASSLVALPVYEPEALSAELAGWRELRVAHLAEANAVFRSLRPSQRVILFCHDPTALPFLAREPEVRARLDQVAQTIIGHLHSDLFFWQSKILSGMPEIRFLGNSVRRMSAALNEAKIWKAFRTRLCPSLAGIELLKDGGYLELDLPDHTTQPVKARFRPLPPASG